MHSPLPSLQYLSKCREKKINPALPEEKKKHRRRARIPAVLDVPRMTSGPMARLVFEDLQAVDLPGIAVRTRNGHGMRMDDGEMFVFLASHQTVLTRSREL